MIRPGREPSPKTGTSRPIAIILGVLIVLPLLVSLRASERGSAPGGYLERTWQTEQGLPQNSVTDIVQTQDGYLWLGTFNGLARFDGVRFVNFTTANSPGLISDSVTALLEDRAGRLWIGTDGSGLSCFRNGAFTSYIATNHPGATVVSALAEDRAGTLWVGTDGGLYRLVGDRLQEFFTTNAPKGLEIVRHLCCDNEGRLWIGAEKGLFVLEKGETRLVSPYRAEEPVAVTADGGVWYFNGSGQLVQFDGGRTNPVLSWVGPTPHCLRLMRNKDIWLGGMAGLSHIRAGTRTDYPMNGGLVDHEVLVIFEDREGNLWVGTNGGGLIQLRERVLETYTTRDGLPGNDVAVLCEDARGRIWIGGFSQGAGILDAGHYRRLPGLPADTRDVYALWHGAADRILLGTRDGRLMGWQNDRIILDKQGLPDMTRVIFEDCDGGQWLGTRLEGVEYHHQGKITRYSPAEGLTSGCVTSILQDRQGAIWVGTKQGLNRIREGKITCFGQEQGLGSDCIHTLYVDPEGELWVGTVGGGLARFKNDRFVTIAAPQGLPNVVIAQIIEDGRGSLWLGSNGGIIRARRAELIECTEGRLATVHCQVFGRNDGMLNPECAGSFQPSCCKGHDGRLWFATVGGVVVIDPARLGFNPQPPNVHIESLLVDGVRYPMPPSTPSSLATVTLPPGTLRLEINYTGLSYVVPERVQFRFRLEGLDARWVEAGERRTAYFNRLTPGPYQFLVTACNNDGVWSKSGAGLALIAAPFWWQTIGFKTACILSLLTIVLAVLQQVHQHRLRRMIELADQRNTRLHAAELNAANRKLQERTGELEQALVKVSTLRGLIPICSVCKKVRNDQGYWQQVEAFVRDHSEAEFSHGLCPECFHGYHRELDRLPPR